MTPDELRLAATKERYGAGCDTAHARMLEACAVALEQAETALVVARADVVLARRWARLWKRAAILHRNDSIALDHTSMAFEGYVEDMAALRAAVEAYRRAVWECDGIKAAEDALFAVLEGRAERGS